MILVGCGVVMVLGNLVWMGLDVLLFFWFMGSVGFRMIEW